MAVSNKRKEEKINTLVQDLFSGNDVKAMAAIKSLQANGDPTVLVHLAELLKTDIPVNLRNEVIQLLNDLLDTEVVPVMMDLLRNEEDSQIRQILLASIWSSKIDYSSFLPDFVAFAIDGDFMEALECLTIIENLEGPFEEQLILESQLHLRDYVQDDAPKDPQKMHIMSEIAVLIKDFDQLEDDVIEDFNV